MNRLETLQALLAENPANTLARYGLATELKNTGDLAGAVGQFQALLETTPTYSAAYFHGGQALEKLGRLEEAKQWYTRGVEVTTASGDEHARMEMQAALDLV